VPWANNVQSRNKGHAWAVNGRPGQTAMGSRPGINQTKPGGSMFRLMAQLNCDNLKMSDIRVHTASKWSSRSKYPFLPIIVLSY
jgi:hypothetical protein